MCTRGAADNEKGEGGVESEGGGGGGGGGEVVEKWKKK